MSSPSGIERRKSRRRQIFDTFSLFVVLSIRGPQRLAVRDVSDLGMRFDLDFGTQDDTASPTAVGDTLDADFYLNQSLSIPLKLQVVRLTQATSETPRQIGVTLVDLHSPSYRAFATFIQLIDAVVEARQSVKIL